MLKDTPQVLLEAERKARLDAESARSKLYRLQYVTSALAQALTPNEIAEIVVTLGAATLSASAGSVWLFNKEKKLHNAAFTGYKKEAMEGIEEVRARDSTPTLDAIKKKKPIILRSLQDRKQLYPHTARIFSLSQKEGFVAIPLLVGEQVLGAINFAFDSYKEFSPDEQEFISTLTQQCAQALDRARLYEREKEDKEEIEKAIERARKLQNISNKLSNALEISDIEKIIVSTAMEVIKVSVGGLFLLSKDKKTLQTLTLKGVSGGLESEWYEFPVTKETSIGYVVITKKADFIENREIYSKKYPKVKEPSEVESFVSLPLIINKEVIGALNFGFSRTKHFVEEEKEFFITLSTQCAQAIGRAMLYESEKKQKEEKEISLQRLKALQEVTLLLSQAKTPKEVAQIIVNSGTKTLGGKAGEIVTYSQKTKAFRIVAYKGFPKEYMKTLVGKDFFTNITQNLFVTDVISTRSPIFVSSKKDVPSPYKGFYSTMDRIDCVSSVYLPLIIDRQVIGVLDFAFSEEKKFEDEEKDFMMIVAQYCAQALDRAFGYQKIKDYSEAIERREARFRSLIENSSDAILLLDKKFNILYRSNSSQKITGEDPKMRIGQPALNVVKEEDRKIVKKWLQDIVKLPSGKTLTLRFRRMTSGKDKWIEATCANFLNDPSVHALVANYRDVTEEVNAVDELRKSRDELDIILRNVIDAVVVMDSRGHVIYANPAALIFEDLPSLETLQNMTYEQAIGNFKGFYDERNNPIPFHQMPMQRILAGEEFITQVIRFEFKDGREDEWRLVKASPVYDEEKNIAYIISIYIDITEEKRKEKLKDEFISTASHELKTPITSAKLYSGILHNTLQESHDEKAFAIVTKIDQQLNRLTHLINDLLDVSKIAAGRVQFKRGKIFLDNVVKEIVEEMEVTSYTHKILLKGSTKSSIYVDSERFRQVLINLISNAIKYSPKSNVVEVVLAKEKKIVTICVKDYGIGIKKENTRKIFEPFYRESHSGGARFPGLGLGLHISSEIIKRHNGIISVESVYGKGAIFCVRLPKVK